MKKSKVCIFLLGLLFCIVAPLTDIHATGVGENDDEVVRTITIMNEIREELKLPSLTYDEELRKTAQDHSKYMEHNNEYSSIEKSDTVYYRGKYPWERAKYQGYDKNYVFELIGKEIMNYESGLKNLIMNPYARNYIFSPSYQDMAMQTYENYTTFLLGGEGNKEYYEIMYPYDGQKNVPTAFTNYYIANPFEQVDDYKEEKTYGYPLTYTFYIPDTSIKSVEDITVKVVKKKDDTRIPVSIITSEDDTNLENSVMILPLVELEHNTIYTVDLQMKVTFKNRIQMKDKGIIQKKIDVQSEFTTIRNMKQDEDEIEYVKRGDFVKDLLLASNATILYALENIFPDVSIKSANYKYVYTAYEKNLIYGYTDGLFRPDSNITVEQAYSVLIREYEQKKGIVKIEETSYENVNFLDKENVMVYARKNIMKCIEIGLIENTFTRLKPKDYITNDQFKVMLEKFVEINE